MGDKTFTIMFCKCLIFFKIRPSLTTSKEGLKKQNIPEETTRVQLWIGVIRLMQPHTELLKALLICVNHAFNWQLLFLLSQDEEMGDGNIS